MWSQLCWLKREEDVLREERGGEPSLGRAPLADKWNLYPLRMLRKCSNWAYSKEGMDIACFMLKRVLGWNLGRLRTRNQHEKVKKAEKFRFSRRSGRPC
ncbi:hypothetical protein AgCh_031125 [Apium graveolens]